MIEITENGEENIEDIYEKLDKNLTKIKFASFGKVKMTKKGG